jgi:hypothetical protein
MVKNLVVCFLMFLVFTFSSDVSSAAILIIDDFDSGLPYNNVGGDAGVWNCNPEDTEQFCNAELVLEEKIGDTGFSLKLIYDIDTSQSYLEGFPNTAYNGYWSGFGTLDVSEYSYFTFYVKGDSEAGYPNAFWIELKDSANISRVKIEKITDSWQKKEIPLSEFSNIKEWYNLTELAIVFDQVTFPKEGVIYIDNIAFE